MESKWRLRAQNSPGVPSRRPSGGNILQFTVKKGIRNRRRGEKKSKVTYKWKTFSPHWNTTRVALSSMNGLAFNTEPGPGQETYQHTHTHTHTPPPSIHTCVGLKGDKMNPVRHLPMCKYRFENRAESSQAWTSGPTQSERNASAYRVHLVDLLSTQK